MAWGLISAGGASGVGGATAGAGAGTAAASAAMPWGAIIGGGVSALSNILGSSGASTKLEHAARDANQVSQQLYNQQRADLAPYRETGTSAQNALARALGLPQYEEPTYGQYSQIGKATEYDVVRAFREFRGRDPSKKERDYYTGRQRANQLYDDVVAPGIQEIEARQAAEQAANPQPQDPYGGFIESPGYQFRFDEGARAVDRNAAARGLFNSGARGKALTRYGQGVASDEFGNYINRLSGVATQGQNAATTTANAGQNYAANANRATSDEAMARASGYLGASGAISSGINNVLASMPYWNTTRNRRTPGSAPYDPTNPYV